MKRLLLGTLLAAAILSVPLTASVGSTPTTTGSWEAYPGQSTAYETQVKQPINADGSSVFANNMKSVIPVKFGLLSGLGPFVFESICSDNPGCSNTTGTTANDFSFLSFTPSASLFFYQLNNLTAVYDFTLGDCHGGSLRWQVRVDSNGDGMIDNGDKAVFIYYGLPPAFGNGGLNGCEDEDTMTLGASQSGINLLDQSEQSVLRFDTSEFNGIFYNNYAGALAAAGNYRVWRASLVLDSGWQVDGDQRLTLGPTTVNDNTFPPPSSTMLKSTCDLPPAEIKVTKVSNDLPQGPVIPISIQPADTNGQFRIVDCKYMYNLATSSLLGTGRYKVEAVIDGVPVDGEAYFWRK